MVCMKRALFRNFTAWLLDQPPGAIRGVSDSTRLRWATGEIPANLLWLLDHPQALEALARDARALTSQERRKLKEAARERGRKQKETKEARNK
jgi:hypothetical protein